MDPRIINRMLELRVKDLASKSPGGTVDERRRTLRKSLGLEPIPPRTVLNAGVTGTLVREGYRIDKVRYESRPGVLVTAHLYLPAGEGPWPVVLRPHGHWYYKKADPIVQAGGISLALAGFACLVVDSPGVNWDDNPYNERRAMGPHIDLFLSMGSPVLGVYVWDLIRGLDYLETRSDVDSTKVGITGASGGGVTTMYAFALDDRISVAVPVASVASLEVNPHLGCLCHHLPEMMANGDRSDMLGMRAPDGAVMILAPDVDEEFPIEGHIRCYEKLREIYARHGAEKKVRFEQFRTGHDYNRRMREAALAFFSEHLKGAPPAQYQAETKLLFDGNLNPSSDGIEEPTQPDFAVTQPHERATKSFRELLGEALDDPYPEPYCIEDRLVPWRTYGALPDIRPRATLAIHDSTIEAPSSIALPVDEIDQKLCILLGLSVSELLAQLLHSFLPAGASPRLVVAQGPVASLTARFLNRYRPELQIDTTHSWTSWKEALESNIPQTAQPNARYLEWV